MLHWYMTNPEYRANDNENSPARDSVEEEKEKVGNGNLLSNRASIRSNNPPSPKQKQAPVYLNWKHIEESPRTQIRCKSAFRSREFTFSFWVLIPCQNFNNQWVTHIFERDYEEKINWFISRLTAAINFYLGTHYQSKSCFFNVLFVWYDS